MSIHLTPQQHRFATALKDAVLGNGPCIFEDRDITADRERVLGSVKEDWIIADDGSWTWKWENDPPVLEPELHVWSECAGLAQDRYP